MGLAQARSHWDSGPCSSTEQPLRLPFPFANIDGYGPIGCTLRRPVRGIAARADSARHRGEMGREHSEIEFMLAGLTPSSARCSTC
jgi:hypothetical protein